MRCEVVAVGTELLLGQVVDTNSASIGEELARAGIDCHFQTKVGDNQARITTALRVALDRSDAVLVCGGLGPTPGDVTREALADVLGVPLERDEAMAGRIRSLFAERNRPMADNNLRQADRPRGAAFIEQAGGTAPGLICPVPAAGEGSGSGGKVIYAVPGVPTEMAEMVRRAVVPDLRRRVGEGASTIASRSLRTWGVSESALAELVADRVAGQTNPTIAFLAAGREGIKLRITARAADRAAADALIAAEEAALRAVLGHLVFGADEESMARAVGRLVADRGWTLGVAESLTGGLVGACLAEDPGSSDWFRGSIVAYDKQVKFDVLGVPEGPVVSAEAAEAMAVGAARVLRTDVGLGVTGAAGPAPHEGEPPGTVFLATSVEGVTDVQGVRLPGDRQQVRDLAVISLLDLLRTRLLGVPPVLDRTKIRNYARGIVTPSP